MVQAGDLQTHIEKVLTNVPVEVLLGSRRVEVLTVPIPDADDASLCRAAELWCRHSYYSFLF